MSSVPTHDLNTVKDSETFTKDEGDLEFLTEKPKVGSRKSDKGRRNANILQGLKQEGDKTIFYKELLNTETLSKKRRAQLMGDLNNKNFNFDVAYSLNRKYRWEDIEDAGDLMAKDNSVVPDTVDVTGVDTYLRMERNSIVSAYHDMSEDGTVETTNFKNPHRGIKLNQLNQTKKDKKRFSKRLTPPNAPNACEDNSKPTVQYVLSKVQPVPALLGKTSVREKNPKNKRQVQYANEDYDLESSLITDGDEDTDMTTSIAALYRAPRERNFSLADFITERSMVMIQPKSIETIELSSDNGESDSASIPDDSFNYSIDQHQLCQDAFFDKLEINANQIGASKDFAATFDELAVFPELRFRWLDKEKMRCVVDLTLRLDELASKIVFVIVVEKLTSKDGKLRVILNGSFPLPDYLVEYITEKTFTSASDFINRIVEKSLKMYISTRSSQKPRTNLAPLNAVYHAYQLTQPIEPLSDYKILPNKADTTLTVESIVVDISDHNSESGSEESEDFEFVVVDMDELDYSDPESIVDDDDVIEMEELEVIPDFDFGCDLCTEFDVDNLYVLEGCKHRFCRQCLCSELTATIVHKPTYPLMCLNSSCKTHIRLDILPTLVPLPLTQYYMRFALMTQTVAAGKRVVECPHCNDLGIVTSNPTYGTVKCGRCSICFCVGCQRQPHFPLTCGQLSMWEEKFEKQYIIDLARASPSTFRKCPCGQLLQNTTNHHTIDCKSCATSYLWKTGESVTPGANGSLISIIPASLNNVIAAEFSEIASLAHSTRFNLKANRQITKDMCKTVDFRLKQAFIEMRKLALHLIEFGAAWLYLTRTERPTSWSTVKATLIGLRTKLNIMHATITGGNGLEEKIIDFNGFTNKTLDEFTDL